MKNYIITSKDDNRVIAIGEELSVQENGNWLLAKQYTAYPNTICDAYDADGKLEPTTDPATIGEGLEVPEGVEPEKYLYDGKEFTENPNYEPPKTEDERLEELVKEYLKRKATESDNNLYDAIVEQEGEPENGTEE